jgi:LysM repeat protein
MLKKTLALLAGLCVSLAVYAASSELQPNHPDTYTVKKGDTLWDISARFLRKPWLWPEIWQANPQVHNPHLIYPGDVLNLSYDVAKGPMVTLKPRVHESGTPISAIPLSKLKIFLRDLRVVDSKTVKQAPYVLAFEENRMRGTPGHFVYVRGLKDATPGQRFAVVRPSHMFRGFGGDDSSAVSVAHMLDSNVAMNHSPWAENTRNDGHYGKGKDLGVEVRVIGTVRMMRKGDPATMMLTDSKMEIRQGDRLLPVNDNPYDPYYYPHAPKAEPKGGHVVALADSLYAAGRHQVIALSVGRQDGVDNGTTFSVFQPGEVVHDERSFGPHVKLPKEFVGHVMVFRTFDHVAYALVMDDVRPIRPGDTLAMPE